LSLHRNKYLPARYQELSPLYRRVWCWELTFSNNIGGRRGRDRMGVGFTTRYWIQHYVIVCL
jgi:hypothetical protein